MRTRRVGRQTYLLYIRVHVVVKTKRPELLVFCIFSVLYLSCWERSDHVAKPSMWYLFFLVFLFFRLRQILNDMVWLVMEGGSITILLSRALKS